MLLVWRCTGIFFFSSLPSVEDFAGIQSCASTPADEEYLYKNYFCSANSLLTPLCFAAHSTGRNPTKVLPLCASHRLFASLKLIRKAWIGYAIRAEPFRGEAVISQNIRTNSKSNFGNTVLSLFENTFYGPLRSTLRQVLLSNIGNCARFYMTLKIFFSVWTELKVGCVFVRFHSILEEL